MVFCDETEHVYVTSAEEHNVHHESAVECTQIRVIPVAGTWSIFSTYFYFLGIDPVPLSVMRNQGHFWVPCEKLVLIGSLRYNFNALAAISHDFKKIASVLPSEFGVS